MICAEFAMTNAAKGGASRERLACNAHLDVAGTVWLEVGLPMKL